jgi:hypothetical protein
VPFCYPSPVQRPYGRYCSLSTLTLPLEGLVPCKLANLIVVGVRRCQRSSAIVPLVNLAKQIADSFPSSPTIFDGSLSNTSSSICCTAVKINRTYYCRDMQGIGRIDRVMLRRPCDWSSFLARSRPEQCSRNLLTAPAGSRFEKSLAWFSQMQAVCQPIKPRAPIVVISESHKFVTAGQDA